MVVDAEHGVRREHRGDHAVELLGGGEVMAERLLDDHAPPGVALRMGQARFGQLLGDDGERPRRHGQVERVVAVRAAGLIQLLDGLRQAQERVGIVERALHEADAAGQLLPGRLAERRAAVLFDVLLDPVGEILVAPVAPAETGQAELRGQQSPVGQGVDGRQELLAGEVAGDAEDDDRARPGDPRQPEVPRIAQGVGPGVAVFRHICTSICCDGSVRSPSLASRGPLGSVVMA